MRSSGNAGKPAQKPLWESTSSGESSEYIFSTELGKAFHFDAKVLLGECLKPESVNLIMTSPPYALLTKKSYGNVHADEYLEWFRPFGELFKRVLKPNGSLVIDIGGTWIKGQPTRSLYHYELLIMLCKELGFHLAQDFFWWSPSRIPSAEWVTVRRIRVKDSIDLVWWLSPTPWPKASNRRVLTPYGETMNNQIKNGRSLEKHPSGHDIGETFLRDNGASIPPNLLAFPNAVSNSPYSRYCKEHNLPQHPARFPSQLPEYFIRMLTDPGDLVVDPFAGSCTTGEVAERLNRRWICADLDKDYLLGGRGRFEQTESSKMNSSPAVSYSISNPACLWNGMIDDPLPEDGGKTRPKASKTSTAEEDHAI